MSILHHSKMLIAAIAACILCHIAQAVDIDSKGYVAYCPCMGRFGNQADHFLGALAFTHHLDRTLILPPWIEYPYRQPTSNQIPFDTYFQVEPLREYARVITMETFMKDIAPKLWPPEKRIGFCYRYREGSDCKMKEGNPFGPFWDNFNIDFESYAEYGLLTYSTHVPVVKEKWKQTFPVSKYPVIALAGAPAAFPVDRTNVHLHQYLKWSDFINDQAEKFIAEELPKGPFLGIHMRHGSDWSSACKHVDEERHLFASPQCLGYNFEYGRLTPEICFPPEKLVKITIKKMVKAIKAKSVFVATDADPLLEDIRRALPKSVKVVQRTPTEPHVDLAILAKADHYIGNCVSSFSAFAKRDRDVAGKPSSFWGFDEPKKTKPKKEEL
ncbi:GDP-fucose protein O-fucosyltransferase 1-like [Amphiura filiformis]|uniref:GDP-fucose protein O-fucosyltransferase 1-like n=1 Tax=Amphiura filiformis TaxID=82378 RepID=UPI003B2102F1